MLNFKHIDVQERLIFPMAVLTKGLFPTANQMEKENLFFMT
jgi:hypothetical protein